MATCGVQEILQITFTKKLLDEVDYSFKTICSETTTKHFGNLSILPIQLIKKALSVDFESPLFKSHWFIYTSISMCKLLFNKGYNIIW